MATIRTLCHSVQGNYNNISLESYRIAVRSACKSQGILYNQKVVDSCHSIYFGGFKKGL